MPAHNENMPDAALHLRMHREGVLIADGVAAPPIRFVIDPVTAELVFPADGSMLGAEEWVLFVPRELPEHDRELQLLVTAREVPQGGISDRWMAYHGTPRWAGFASCRVEGARFDGRVLEDGDLAALVEPPGIGRLEGLLLKKLNGDKSRLRAACKRFAQAAVPDPLAVGVDKHGVDVRTTFGIVRLDWGVSSSVEQSVDDLLGTD